MLIKKRQNILVTGAHRSGSTWVGKVLASNGTTGYVHEPFNIHNSKKFKSPIKTWFEYVSSDASQERKKQFNTYITNYLSSNAASLSREFLLSSPKKWKDIIKKHLDLLSKKDLVIKDPIAVFSTEWLATTLEAKVLLLVRHPAAFADSLKRKGWFFDFDDFMKNHRPEDMQIFETEMDQVATNDIIGQAIILWKMIYSHVLKMRSKNPGWLLVRHEDISQNPVQEFEKIFKQLDLSFNDEVREYLLKTTSAQVTSELERNSRENAYKWKKSLSQGEIKRIYDGTREVAENFYKEEEWQL